MRMNRRLIGLSVGLLTVLVAVVVVISQFAGSPMRGDSKAMSLKEKRVGQRDTPSRVISPLMKVSATDETELEESEEKLKSFRKSEYDRNEKLNLFVRIVDQHGYPVPDVKLIADVSYIPLLVVPGMGFSTKTIKLASDENGEFSIENQTGLSIDIYSAEKRGYEFNNLDQIRSGSYPGRSSPDNRYIFRAWKHETLKTRVRKGSLSVMFKPDGQFVPVDFDRTLHEARVPPGPPSGDLYVAVRAGPRDAEGYFDWTVTVRAIDGGLAERGRGEPYPYVAPEDGYLPEWTHTVVHDQGVSRLEKAFYLKSRGGARYSKIHFTATPTWDNSDEQALISVNFTMNLDGARELQPPGRQ